MEPEQPASGGHTRATDLYPSPGAAHAWRYRPSRSWGLRDSEAVWSDRPAPRWPPAPLRRAHCRLGASSRLAWPGVI
eukprot:scaffold373_cov421-Prasinococcus_capsulatus_cf.AAC.4